MPAVSAPVLEQKKHTTHTHTRLSLGSGTDLRPSGSVEGQRRVTDEATHTNPHTLTHTHTHTHTHTLTHTHTHIHTHRFKHYRNAAGEKNVHKSGHGIETSVKMFGKKRSEARCRG